MKLRGESGSVPARMGGVPGTFTPRGGSIAKRAVKKKSAMVKVLKKPVAPNEPIKINTNPKKVVVKPKKINKPNVKVIENKKVIKIRSNNL